MQTQLQDSIVKSIRGMIRSLLKSLILALVGASLLSMGAIFIWLGVHEYLVRFLTKEASWLLVGSLSILIGIALILFASPKHR